MKKSNESLKTKTETDTVELLLPSHLQHLDADQLEELASHDFQDGGKFGNEVARQMAVMTNPYAKMCGAIVKEAMKKEIEG